MASYQRTGKKMCQRCNAVCLAVKCPVCGEKTRSEGKWSVSFYVTENGKRTLRELSGFEKKMDAQAAYREFMNKHTTEAFKEESNADF